ncbi:YjfB family protein [Hathewaya limosa]|uniref:Motility protein n=1 Tax=Hathewaya limosa TaxID=1536 RepID=A0ABU0JTG5_HATLI|nr:YjfB family protein [Hathewaya limosa]MDQ0480391.1 hypothetical protein [Hathewaya limosa]
MDIGAVSMSMSQQKTQDAVSLSLMRMVMDTNKQGGADMIQMMETMAVDPNLGHHLDTIV